MTINPIHEPDSATSWMTLGLCRTFQPGTFFPSDGIGVDRAIRVCAGCAVRTECLDHALDNRIEHGVWGGCSERERRRILKRRRAAASTFVVIKSPPGRATPQRSA